MAARCSSPIDEPLQTASGRRRFQCPIGEKKEAHAAILDHLLRRLPGRQEAPDASATGLRAGEDRDAGRSRLLALDTAHLGPKRTRQRSMAQVSAATLRQIRSLAPDSGQRPAASRAVRPNLTRPWSEACRRLCKLAPRTPKEVAEFLESSHFSQPNSGCAKPRRFGVRCGAGQPRAGQALQRLGVNTPACSSSERGREGRHKNGDV